MSQYIQGIVDYIPQVQPYKPNLNFYQQVLETKNAQYKQGYDQISNLYGTLLESPMLRSENIDLRNKFFNQISAEISKISGLDLSLSQNINAAQQVFQPLVDNKYILKDMSYTKRAYAELNKADNFRNCTDEKTCGGKYWEGGVRAVQYQMADFAKSSAEDSLGFDTPRYTPAVNVGEKAMKFAKDMGFNMQTVSWSSDGNYKITTKNGQQMIPSLTDAFLATFQNDQSARDYYYTQGYLNRKDFASSNVDIYGSEEQAESFYLDEMSKKLFETSSQGYDNSQKDIQKAKIKQTVYDQIIEQRGIDPDDPDDQKIAADRNQALVDQMISQAAGDQYKETQEKVNPETIGIIGLDAKRKRIDAAMANALFTNDLALAAQNYAMLTMEETVDEDKYALARYDHGLTLARMEKQYEYDVDLENKKTANEILKQTWGEGANGASFEGESANPDASRYKIDPAGTGAGGSAEEANLVESDEKLFQSNTDALTGSLQTYAVSINEQLNSIINGEIGTTVSKTGVVITPELKAEAKQKQIELFGKVTEKEEWVENESGLGVGGKIANWFLSDDNEYKGYAPKKTITGGYLNTDGNLVQDLSSVSDFATSDQNGWYQIGQKLNNFINDPRTYAIFGNTLDKKSSADFNIVQKNYFARLNQMKENKKTVHGATAGVESLYLDRISPKYSKEMTAKLYSNGRHLTEAEFIKMYADNRPLNIQKRDSPFEYRLGYSPGSQVYEYNDFKDEAKKLYNKYKETYEKIYNRDDNAAVKGISLSDYSPLQYSIRPNDKGAGVEAQPYTATGLDAAYRGDPAVKDFRNFYENLTALPSARFYATDGRNITEDFLDDAEESKDQTQKALALIHSHLTSGKKKTDSDRARFDLTIHPIVGNDANLAAVTIKMDQEFLENNQGSDKTPKALRNSGGVYTVVMNQEDAKKLKAFERLEKGAYQIEMDSYNSVTLDQYDKAGYIKIQTSKLSDGYTANGYINYYDDNGKIGKFLYNVESNPGQSADSFGAQQESILMQHYYTITNMAEALRASKENLIRDPSKLMK